MQIRYPDYYDQFSCLAGACPDSCCHEWEVDVDPFTAEQYLQLPGELGDRLREVLIQGEDGWASMTLTADRRCPMWRRDGLCHIQAELGHDALCDTCQSFPRLRHDHGDFMELGLEMSCPEAARIILSNPRFQWLTEETPVGEEPEYDEETMSVVLYSRQKAVELALEERLTVGEAVAAVLLYARQVQVAVDWQAVREFDVMYRLEECRSYLQEGSLDALFEMFRGLEILTQRWKDMLEQGAVDAPWQPEHRALLRYLIDRYWLRAGYDGEIVTQAAFIAISCLLVRSLGGNVVETAQLFSKEIENDADNVEALRDALMAMGPEDPLKLIQLLLA